MATFVGGFIRLQFLLSGTSPPLVQLAVHMGVGHCLLSVILCNCAAVPEVPSSRFPPLQGSLLTSPLEKTADNYNPSLSPKFTNKVTEKF